MSPCGDCVLAYEKEKERLQESSTELHGSTEF